MKKTLKSTIAFIFIISAFGFTQGNANKQSDKGCEILHEGTFIYGNTTDEIKVVIDGKKHIEYHNNGKYFIKSKLDWLSDCEYNMTMTKITIPNFPYKKGEVMNVKIDRVEGNEVFYTSTVNGKSWKGKLIKNN